jgi:CRP/FNR family cyclic AMP-dependent transcriptional regulator
MEANDAVQFRVWGGDNIAYGPMELPALVGWIKQSKVRPESWVFKDGSGWSRASEISELRILFKSKAPSEAAAANTIQPASLRRIKMLAEVDDKLLASLLPYLEVLRVSANQTVVTQGDHGDTLFMVLEGEVRARIMIDGKESTLATLGVGECFGELAIIDQGPRSADVIANQSSVLVKMSDKALRKLVTEAPALAAPFVLALTRVIAQRIRHLTTRYEDSIHFARYGQAAAH